MSDFVSWCRHLLVPFFFMNPPLYALFSASNLYTRACYGVVQCLPIKSPTIYRRNLQREKNDRLVSVHTSIDGGEVW